jgi:hypothetical protein
MQGRYRLSERRNSRSGTDMRRNSRSGTDMRRNSRSGTDMRRNSRSGIDKQPINEEGQQVNAGASQALGATEAARRALSLYRRKKRASTSP